MQLQIKTYDIREDYLIEEKLGEGNSASVYRALSKETKREYAVKAIDKRALELDDQIALESEVAIMSRVAHPNVVKLVDVYDTGKFCYLVLEMMEGGELFDRIIERETYSEKDACEVLFPIVDALRFCHKMGIAHRDIKPENLLYSSRGEDAIIKISDFGISRMLDNQLAHTAVGTPNYLAPQVLEGKGYSFKIDYWAIGVILYILLCGYPPFSQDSNEKLFHVIKNAIFQFPEAEWGRISEQAKDLIRHLLEKDPVKRYGADEIMAHAWMKKGLARRTHLAEVPEKIKNYVARRRLKKATLTVYASTVLSKALQKK